ncbi:hypothetical protein BJY04DRAFT_211057 [Aspergillus karnatakaensis]|uniref:uncharacterized protein n=1 Tax=Aspergillus karnatakaensis TaxID=1810916 RepID=UPI003CCDC553
MTDQDTPQFSRLEASFGQTKVAPRRNSVEMKDVFRHAQVNDLNVNDLDFDLSLHRSNYPLENLDSLQDVFSAAQHHTHFSNPRNFSRETRIQCFDSDDTSSSILFLAGLDIGTKDTNAKLSTTNSSLKAGEKVDMKPQRLLAFFVPVIPEKNTSFGSRITMTQINTKELFQTLGVNSLYLMNLLGRPDYWAPQTRWESDDAGEFLACDFFCQHPRWNLHFQGAPLSVYMRYSAALKLTTYIISHKEDDSSIRVLCDILSTATETARPSHRASIFLRGPFEIAVILSTLSFEASKFHAQRFRRFMWEQVNKVDNHLAGLEDSDRRQLSELTKQLQIISQNADSHLGNAEVCIITASAIHTVHEKLHKAISSPTQVHERAADSISYVIESMQKQKIWFLNYKNRKDSTMALVYNLVTQQDAASNIQIASSMKRDSTSMNAIAAVTMTFLPGTFIATILDAGIFMAAENSMRIYVSGLWWLWIVMTIPLTLLVVACWWWYKRLKGKVRLAPHAPTPKDDGDIAPPPKSPTFRLANFRTWTRNDSIAAKV